ncbi:hypothetical protein EH223_13700 [candidate division KSB1 bacterium]|nr:PmoA family protein [candidate division KSB1 bacterium]RQW01982.1 MAG: hypothetical protein EH223_13700 [candidate division KSB1 bacterium]
MHVYAGDFDRLDTPVSVCLDGITINQDHGFIRLYEITDDEKIEIPCQLELAATKRLWWILPGRTEAQMVRHFQIVLGDSIQLAAPVKISRDEKKLIILREERNILQYNHSTVFPPAGVDDIYKRSGFIHPLWSPDGNIMTRIQPPDHYHHYGIWGPWTQTTFEDREVDFWNLAKGQGTVRFAGYLSTIQGPVYAGFQVRQEHVDFSTKNGEKVALNELLDIRVWNLGEGLNVWLWDYTTKLNCATSSPMTLEAYRYGGGIGFRAVESWTKKNVHVLTSSGKTRKDADGSKALWCYVSGKNDSGDRSGIVFLSHPDNREHPEPMRVWPENANGGRGDLFFEFCPIRHNSWTLLPGQDYVLKYRMVVYDGEISVGTAERLWRDFAFPPHVELVSE